MRNLLDRYLFPFRAPEDGGGGGAAAGGAAAGAAAGSAAGAAGAAAAGGEGGSGAAAAAAAGADAGAAAAAASQPYRPEGLPDTMFGKDDRETMDKMSKALNGYRERDATRVVPDKPEAYRDFGEFKDVPEAVKPHLQGLANDPLFDAVSKVAMERKIPVADMQALTTALYTQAQEAGILEHAVDPAAERALLVPESARNLPKAQQDAAIDARMQQNEDFIKLLTKPGADGKPQLDPKVGENALLMLMDTAAGNQFLEFVQSKLTGGDRSQPFAGNGGSAGGAGGLTREALRARQALPENTPGHAKFSKQSYDQLDADFKRAFPE